MKKNFFIFIVFFLSQNLFSQDLIITKQGDSIFCKITSVRNQIYNFITTENNETINSTLTAGEIEKNIYNYEKYLLNLTFHPRTWEIGLNQGISILFGENYNPYLISGAKITSRLSEQNSDLSFKYFPNDNWGIGILFYKALNYYKYNFETNGYESIVTSSIVRTNNFLTLTYRRHSKNFRHVGSITYGAGYARQETSGYYHVYDPANSISQFYSKYTFPGSTLQTTYDFYLTPWFAIGTKIGYYFAFFGNRNDYSIYHRFGPSNYYSNLDLSAGIKVYF